MPVTRKHELDGAQSRDVNKNFTARTAKVLLPLDLKTLNTVMSP